MVAGSIFTRLSCRFDLAFIYPQWHIQTDTSAVVAAAVGGRGRYCRVVAVSKKLESAVVVRLGDFSAWRWCR